MKISGIAAIVVLIVVILFFFMGTARAADLTSLAGNLTLREDFSAAHPNTQIYGDPDTGEYIAVISTVDRWLPAGKSLTWGQAGPGTFLVNNGKYYIDVNLSTGKTQVMEEATGSWSVWTPRIYLNNVTVLPISGLPQLLAVDPINDNYRNNVIQWSYGSGKVLRQLRVIEGQVQEFYIINGNPGGSIRIAPFREATALPSRDYWIESAGSPTPLMGFTFNTAKGEKSLTADLFKTAIYPIIVDDSYSNSTDSADAFTLKTTYDNTTAGWTALHDATAGDSITTSSTSLSLQTYHLRGSSAYSYFYRSPVLLYFNTTSIPTTAAISAANLSLRITGSYGTLVHPTSINITGADSPTYPRMPGAAVDYDFRRYNRIDLGNISNDMWVVDAINNISLTPRGISLINRTGTVPSFTKLALQDDWYDIGNRSPPNSRVSLRNGTYVTFSSSEAGAGWEPRLYVYYTVPPPPVVATFTCDKSVCFLPGCHVQFADTSSGSPSSWLWDFGNGTTSTLQNPLISPPVAGQFNISLQATGAGGSDWENKTALLLVFNTAPTVSWNLSALYGNLTKPFNFVDLSTGTNITARNWSFGDGNVSALRNVTGKRYPSTAESTLYSINFSATDSALSPWNLTGWSNQSNYVKVYQNSSPTVSFTQGPVTGTVPLSVTFAATAAGLIKVDSWLWNFGDSGTSSLEDPVHAYTTAGQFTVTLTASNYTLGQAVVTKSNLILATNPAPVVSGSRVPVMGTVSTPILFTDASTGTNITGFRWDFHDGNSSALQNPTHQFPIVGAGPTPYDIGHGAVDSLGTPWEVTAWGNQTTWVTIYNSLAPNFTFTGTPLSGVRPLKVYFTAVPAPGFVVDSYTWDYGAGEGLYTSTGTAAANTYFTGTWNVALTGYNATHGYTTVFRPAYVEVGDLSWADRQINGTFPTMAEVDFNNTGIIDFENDTYLRYWFNYSAPYDFPWVSIIYSLTLPFTITMGSWFYVIIWFLYLAMLYLRAQDPTPVLIIGILSATVMGAFFPTEAYIPAILMFAAASVAILMRVLKERQGN